MAHWSPPPDSKKAPSRTSRDRTVTVLLGVIALLLAVIAAGVVFLVVSRDEESDGSSAAATDGGAGETPEPTIGESPSLSPSPTDESNADATPTPEATQTALTPEVRTDRPSFGMQVENISLTQEGTIMAFAIVHHGTSCDRFFYNKKQLSRSYLVDQGSGKQFGVAKGPNGAPLVSPAQGRLLCNPRDAIRFSIEFKAPRPGSTVDVFVPFAEPIRDLTLS
jgi:hypothetical protein